MSVQWHSLLPAWLTWLTCGALLAALVYGAVSMFLKRVPRKWALVLTGLRLAVACVFLLILLQPSISVSREVPDLPELLVLVDTSASMGKHGDDDHSRLEEVTSVLEKGDLAAALHKRFGLHWFTFDRSASPLEEKDLDKLRADGKTTQVADSIAAACAHVRALGKQPRRLLLVSDGNDLGLSDAAVTAGRLGVIVDVLPPKSSAPAENSSPQIVDVQGARRVLLGSETLFRVTVGSKQPADRDQTLTLRASENGKPIPLEPLILKAGRTEATVVLAHRPTALGLQRYEFQLGSGPASVLPVQVLDNKYEVLILEDTWRWEYKYLHRLFEDDPSFRFTALLAQGNGFARFGSPDRRVKLVGFPQSKAQLEEFDTFVLGDVKASRWPRDLALGLAQLVADEGKSLVVIAGPNLGQMLDIPELHALLPVELTRESGTPVEGPIEVRLRADGRGSAFFFQIPSADRLPPLDQIYPVLRKRPGATVLVEADKKRNAYGNLIVMAEHTVGRGRVLFVATDTLWKWQTLAASADGPTPYGIFWQQAFRAMTPTRLSLGGNPLWLTTSRSRVEVGQAVSVQVEVASSQANLQATVTLPDDTSLPLVFRADPAQPRLLRAEFAASKPGVHRIAASLVDDEGRTVADGSTALSVDETRGELDDQGIDLNYLARLAQATGGLVVDPARPETWPNSTETTTAVRTQIRTIDLWHNFTLMLALCALLAADWFIRLFKGLIAG